MRGASGEGWGAWIEVGRGRGRWVDVRKRGRNGEGAGGDVAESAFYAKLGSIQGPFRVLCRRMDPAGARAGSPALVAAGALEPAGELEGFDAHGSGTTAQVLRGDVQVVRARRETRGVQVAQAVARSS